MTTTTNCFDIIRNMKITEAARSLGAIANPTRLAIFRLLVQAGPAGLSAGEIAHRLALAPATLSFHLKELALADLVHAQPLGRFVIYAASFARMAQLVDFLTRDCCDGNPEVCAPLQPRAPRPVKSHPGRSE